MITEDEVFDACDRQDRLLGLALGATLERATLRLVAIVAALCAAAAILAVLLPA